MNPETPCIFCEIAAGRAPRSLVYEDTLALAFLDIQPVNPGHTLVVPRAHFASLADLDEAVGRHLFTIAQRIAQAVRESDLHCEGVNLFLADGEAAFQDVFHVHLHVLPRFSGDSFKIHADWSARPERFALDQVAGAIHGSYRRLWETGGGHLAGPAAGPTDE